MEAVQPIELEIPSLRIVLERKIPEAAWVQARYDELVMLDERRLQPAHHVQVYQPSGQTFQQKGQNPKHQRRRACPESPSQKHHGPKGKIQTQVGRHINCQEDPLRGAVELTDADGTEFRSLTNLDQLKKLYVYVPCSNSRIQFKVL